MIARVSCDLLFAGAAITVAALQSDCLAQITRFPFTETFDVVSTPLLPSGWSSTKTKWPGDNDFTTVASSPHSSPNAVLATNATVPQALNSPVYDFSREVPGFLSFWLRRSASFNACVVVEGSQDGGTTFGLLLGDTLRQDGVSGYVFHRLAIPRDLTGCPGAVIRWRVIPDSTGTSGTMRLDDVTVGVQMAVDLTPTRVGFFPPSPEIGENVNASVTVVNRGVQTCPGFSVDLYQDANNDSTPQSGELLGRGISVSQVRSKDSVDVQIPFVPSLPGEHNIIALVTAQEDRDSSNDECFAALIVGYPPGCMNVNEIMYAPMAPEPEWVELYNPGRDSIDLNNWLLSDAAVTTRHTIVKQPLPVAPESYAVLTRDSSAFRDIHPGTTCPVLQVPGFPSLNNSGDLVALYDNRGRTIDSVPYLYPWGGNIGGKSLERIDYSGASSASSNWATSRSREGSTPGGENSRARRDFDLAVDSVWITPGVAGAGEMMQIAVAVRNQGRRLIEGFDVSFVEDVTQDSTQPWVGVVRALIHSGPLPPLESVTVPYSFVVPRGGTMRWRVFASCAEDEDTTNNSGTLSFLAGYTPGSIRINEMMFAPPAGMPEWMELVNSTPDTISLAGWWIGNRNRSGRYEWTGGANRIQPGGFIVVTKDSAMLRAAYGEIPGSVLELPLLPTFLWNNTGDAVVIEDGRRTVVDSVYYFASWGTLGGASLERIDLLSPPQDSTNWGSSVSSAHGTPGRANSIMRMDDDLRISRASWFSSRETGETLVHVNVVNAGKRMSGSFSVDLFVDANGDSVGEPGELIGSGAYAQALPPRDSAVVTVAWDHPRAGSYRCVATVVLPGDMRSSNNTVAFVLHVPYEMRALVINEIMAEPLAGESEYVELCNAGAGDVDLAGWYLTGLPAGSGPPPEFLVSEVPATIAPGGFVVVAADSSIFRRFPDLLRSPPGTVTVVHPANLGLRDDGDVVILRDPSGTTVDSVAYLSSWRNPSFTDYHGRSLEKLRPSFPSNDSRAWSSCVLGVGGSPGLPNSVFTSVPSSRSRLSFFPNPFSPDDDGRDDFVVIHYEMPERTSALTISIFDVRGRLVRRLVNNEPGGYAGEVVWDGRDEGRQKLRIGMYIVWCEGLDEKGGVLITSKGVVVLAGKL